MTLQASLPAVFVHAVLAVQPRGDHRVHADFAPLHGLQGQEDGHHLGEAGGRPGIVFLRVLGIQGPAAVQIYQIDRLGGELRRLQRFTRGDRRGGGLHRLGEGFGEDLSGLARLRLLGQSQRGDQGQCQTENEKKSQDRFLFHDVLHILVI